MVLTTAYIKQVVSDYFKDKPVAKAYLFGSYANGNADENSDVDILFSINKEVRMSYFILGGYLVDLEERLNKKVDLVEDGFLFKSFENKINKEKELIFERKS